MIKERGQGEGKTVFSCVGREEYHMLSMFGWTMGLLQSWARIFLHASNYPEAMWILFIWIVESGGLKHQQTLRF